MIFIINYTYVNKVLNSIVLHLCEVRIKVCYDTFYLPEMDVFNHSLMFILNFQSL